MGDFIVLNPKRARNPLMMQQDSQLCFSLEELCYYLQEHLFLLNADSIQPELFSWLKSELGLSELAQRLESSYEKRASVYEIVLELFEASGFYGREDLEAVRETIRAVRSKSEPEKKKMLADYQLENGREKDALYQYLLLLDEKNRPYMSESLLAQIWHNIGVVYAHELDFAHAGEAFSRAYALSSQTATRDAWILADLMERAENGEDAPSYQDCPAEIGEEDYAALLSGFKKKYENVKSNCLTE